jgi:hypothetical protein
VAWARIDDAFDDHPKVLAVLEHDQGGAAIGLWTLCLTWAHRNTLRRNKTPGLLPASLPRRYLGPGARELAALLVKEGLWEPLAEEDGWQIHDFERYLPTEKTSAARSEAGKKGAASRWGKAAGRDGNLPSGDGKEPNASHGPDGKTMATDGNRVAEQPSEHPSGTEGTDDDSPDGKEPSGHGNLPSGSQGTMANDGSRAPVRRAISNEIAPVPEPVLPPTAAQESSNDTAQTLIAEWLDHCRKRPPQRVIGQVAKELGLLLAEGQDVEDVRRGLAHWHAAAKHPSTLASFVNEAMNGSSSGRKGAGPSVPATVSPRDEHRYRR